MTRRRSLRRTVRPGTRWPGTGAVRATRRSRREGGFTLVEVMIAVLLLALVMGSLAYLFSNATNTGSDSNHRAQAAQLISSELATAQSAPYDEVGFYCDQLGLSSGCTDGSTVILPGSCGSTCAAVARFQPASSTLNGITFGITTSITWADATAPSGTDEQAYKLVDVTVQWKFAGQTESRESSTIVYPGGLGPYTGPGSSVTTTTFSGPLKSVCSLTATVPSDPTASWQEIDLNWTLPSQPQCAGDPNPPNYVIEWAPDPSTSTCPLPASGASGTGTPPQAPGMSLEQLGSETQFAVQGLTASTPYCLVVLSVSSTNWVASDQVTATTTAPPAQPCTWSSFTVTGDSAGKVYLETTSGGTDVTDTAIALVANSNAGCSTGSVTVTVIDTYNGVSDSPVGNFLLTGTNGVWTGTIPQGQAWTAGTHSDELLVDGNSVSPAVTQSLLVCPPPTVANKKNTGKDC